MMMECNECKASKTIPLLEELAFDVDLELATSLENDTFSTYNTKKWQDRTSSWFDFLLEPRVSRGNQSLPFQVEARKFLKFLILVPSYTLALTVIFAYLWLPFFVKQGLIQFTERLFMDGILQNGWATVLLVVLPLSMAILYDLMMESWTFVMLVRGRRRRHLPDDQPRLIHAVIVCNYKEPLEVLEATINSIARNTLAASTIVVLACEERDPAANIVFSELESKYRQAFRNFLKTTHTLAPNEVAGKSSNENFACRELDKIVKKEGIDPFRVMVTTCDADSLFDKVFFEQVEAEFFRMPDGRRFIYNSPINTYRNLPLCNPIVRAFEIKRCQYDLFKGTSFRPAQSNYSLTLGFASEINFWDPGNTSEDFHTTLKAMATTGQGSTIVVSVWSIILNDSVCTFKDRWIQAKRHMWGIEEFAYIITLFPVLRISLWLELLGRVGTQMFQACIPSYLLLIFGPIRQVFFALRKESQILLVACYVAASLYSWTKAIVREMLLYRIVLRNRPLVMNRSLFEWLQLIMLWPILSEIGSLVFVTLATWRMLLHAVFRETLTYITAPKTLTLGAKGVNDRRDKAKHG